MSRVFAKPNVHLRDHWQSWDKLKFFMIGVDGSRWNFGAKDSPVRLHRPPTGLNGAPVTHDYQVLTGMDGAVYRGSQDGQLPIGLQVWIADARSQAWARRSHSDWRKAFGRGKDTVRLFAVSKESGYWWIDARIQSVSEVNWFDQQPGLVGESGELVTLITDRSYWHSFDVEAVTGIPVSEGADYKTWEIDLPNPGDQDMWPRFEISGGFTSVTIGIGTDTFQTIPSIFTASTIVGSAFDGDLLAWINQQYTALAQAISDAATQIYGGEQPAPDPENPDPRDEEFNDLVAQLRVLYLGQIQDAVSGIVTPEEVEVNLSGQTIFIDTDPLWPSIVTSSGQDLTPYLPDVRWVSPVPARGTRAEQKVTISAINASPTFKVAVKGAPRSEMPW